MADGSFRAIFEAKSREEFSRSPASLTGYLIEKRFPKEDISAYRTIARFCPAVVSKLLRGDVSPEEAAAMASKQAKVDLPAARSLFERMCGQEEAEDSRPEPVSSVPAPRAYDPRPAMAEAVPAGLVMSAEGLQATVLRYVGNAPCLKIPSHYRGHKVTSIADNAFEGCGGLTSVGIPDTVEAIGKESFSGCGSLASVKLPESLRTLGEKAFCYCDSLERIEIPSKVETVRRLAFFHCQSLTSVKMPASAKSIA